MFISYKINEKSDIYSLGIIFWELTSRSSPFNFETRLNNVVMLEILKGEREKPIPGTNVKYIELYQSIKSIVEAMKAMITLKLM